MNTTHFLPEGSRSSAVAPNCTMDAMNPYRMHAHPSGGFSYSLSNTMKDTFFMDVPRWAMRRLVSIMNHARRDMFAGHPTGQLAAGEYSLGLAVDTSRGGASPATPLGFVVT